MLESISKASFPMTIVNVSSPIAGDLHVCANLNKALRDSCKNDSIEGRVPFVDTADAADAIEECPVLVYQHRFEGVLIFLLAVEG